MYHRKIFLDLIFVWNLSAVGRQFTEPLAEIPIFCRWRGYVFPKSGRRFLPPEASNVIPHILCKAVFFFSRFSLDWPTLWNPLSKKTAVPILRIFMVLHFERILFTYFSNHIFTSVRCFSCSSDMFFTWAIWHLQTRITGKANHKFIDYRTAILV